MLCRDGKMMFDIVRGPKGPLVLVKVNAPMNFVEEQAFQSYQRILAQISQQRRGPHA